MQQLQEGRPQCQDRTTFSPNPEQLRPVLESGCYDQVQLRVGCNIEHEHTTEMGLACQIARNHLDESPDYYKRLAAMEHQTADDPRAFVPFEPFAYEFARAVRGIKQSPDGTFVESRIPMKYAEAVQLWADQYPGIPFVDEGNYSRAQLAQDAETRKRAQERAMQRR